MLEFIASGGASFLAPRICRPQGSPKDERGHARHPLSGLAVALPRVMSLSCTGNRVSARNRAVVRSKAESRSNAEAKDDRCPIPASDRCPVLVPPLQDVPEFKPRVSARG